jgi:exosome complex RNA-binding protein Rrp42 (RNase PH superfamily)
MYSNNNNNDDLAQLQLFLQRIVEECLNLEQFVIVPNQAVYRLAVIFEVLEADGNFINAYLTACVNTDIPSTNSVISSIESTERVYLPDDNNYSDNDDNINETTEYANNTVFINSRCMV